MCKISFFSTCKNYAKLIPIYSNNTFEHIYYLRHPVNVLQQSLHCNIAKYSL